MLLAKKFAKVDRVESGEMTESLIASSRDGRFGSVALKGGTV
jgi:hypothetical protein